MAAPRGPTALLCAAALLFSVMALCVKRASAHLPGAEIAFLRFAIGLGAVAVVMVGGRRLRPRDLRSLFWRGAFGGAAVLLYFHAITRLPVGLATLLNYSSPLFTILLSAIFLGERAGWRTGLALCVALSGVALVAAADPGGLSLSGQLPAVLIGLLSAVLSGAAVTMIRAMRQHEGSWEIFCAFCLVGGAMTAVPTALRFVPPSPMDWAWVVGAGLSSVVAQILMTHALRDVRAAAGVLLLQLTPASTLLLGGLLLREPLTPLGLAGAALTVLGVCWGVLGRRA